MRAYIQCDWKNMPFNETVFNAYLGFEELGTETVLFKDIPEIMDTGKDDIIVGGLGPTKWKLVQLGCEYPELDYPEELLPYMGRRIWKSTINAVSADPDCWPIFVKPYVDKIFTGRVVHSTADLVGCGSCYENYEVICSELIDLRAEWRAFVRYGKVVDVRGYKGDWRLHYDPEIIERCVATYCSQPAAFAMDIGLTADGRTVLIEINDGFSVGSYGLFHIDYAKFLASRWVELTGIEDEYDFSGERARWRRRLFS